MIECVHDWELGCIRQLSGNPLATRCVKCKLLRIHEHPYDDKDKLDEIIIIRNKYYLSLGFLIGSILSSFLWLFFSYVLR